MCNLESACEILGGGGVIGWELMEQKWLLTILPNMATT